MFKELFMESDDLQKGQKYTIIAYDENKKEMNRIEATYKGIGKRRQSPNKGKDVYIFTDSNGKRLAIGLWEVKKDFVKIEK